MHLTKYVTTHQRRCVVTPEDTHKGPISLVEAKEGPKWQEACHFNIVAY